MEMTEADISAFWRYVEKSGACWLWRGEIRPNGYGRWKRRGRRISAHRTAFLIQHGPIPDGHYVCHTCDTKACCRGEHLFAGTPLDNMRDKMAKGRWGGGRPRGSRSTRGAGEDHPLAKLTAADVAAIRAAYVPRKVSQYALAARYGVSRSAIEGIVHGTRWR